MEAKLDIRRIVVFLAFAFGIAWAVGLVVFLTGGLANSPVLVSIPGFVLTLSVVLVAVGYMMAPTFAHILTRLVTREGWQNVGLRPHLKRGWPFWLAGWFGPALLTFVGTALFFVLFPRFFDPTLGPLREQMEAVGQVAPLTPWAVIIINTLGAMLTAPLINGLFTFGEEFGWRAYLQPRLMPLGGRRAMLLMGLIWGVWHWPIIAMGHNYGIFGNDYFGAPWTGMLMMVWFCFVSGTFLGWITLRGGSVWPAVIGHAALNGIASIGLIFLQGQPSLLLGPLPVGLVGSAGFALVTLLLYLWPGALDAPPAAEPVAPAPSAAAVSED